MARGEHLPIYKRSYALCLYLERVATTFPRYHEYAIGSDLRAGARRVLRGVVRANAGSRSKVRRESSVVTPGRTARTLRVRTAQRPVETTGT
jgi:hypothetical protein